MCSQSDDIAALSSKNCKSQSDLYLKRVSEAHDSLLKRSFGQNATAADAAVLELPNFGKQHDDMLALQKQTLALAQKQASTDVEEGEDGSAAAASAPASASQPAEPAIVPLPLAMRGPAAVARQLLVDANCTGEQMDTLALMALSLQRRFDARPDKTSQLLPVATAGNNHKAVWLGGGGVGKTRTLSMVVQPLAETLFGAGGYSATAQQMLGSRGRTLHAANGLLMAQPL